MAPGTPWPWSDPSAVWQRCLALAVEGCPNRTPSPSSARPWWICSTLGLVAQGEEVAEIEREFSALAVALFAPDTVSATLQAIVDLAVEAVDGCDAAGTLVVRGGRLAGAAVTSRLVEELDAAQIGTGEGPCLDASASGVPFYASDLLDDARWPRFTPIAIDLGIRSVLAYPLLDDRSSALNLYGHLPSAFGATGRAQGLLFATLAGIALGSAENQESEEARTGNLHEALQTREVIGQAQGILMERERITATQAFTVLRRASQALNIKLRDVAERLVETGEAPASLKSDRSPPPTEGPTR